MRVLVCGGRDYQNVMRVWEILDLLPKKDLVIIQGDARGADELAKTWAKNKNVECLSFPADWNKYGKRAGYIRNAKMLDEGKPDLVIAFPGGKGTDMMVMLSESAGIVTKRVKDKNFREPI